jgi:hypothetical protein
MALPSTGALSLLMIQGEFGGPTTDIAMNQYYAGGSFVPAGTSGDSGPIPSSGQISISQFYGSQSLIAKGYFGGGGTAPGFTNSAVIDGIRFDTEAAINPAAALSQARVRPGGVNSSARGFFGGGQTPGRTTVIDGIRFDTEAAINPAATLSIARDGVAGINSDARGFFGGGFSPSPVFTRFNTIDGIRFDTEAAINPAAALSQARDDAGAVCSSTRGFFGGGDAPGFGGVEYSRVIDGIRFDTEAAINPAAALSTAPVERFSGRYALDGANSSTKGYFFGGQTRLRGTTTGIIDAFTFSTETISLLSATMSVVKRNYASVSSSSTQRGFCGGGTVPPAITNNIDGIRFDTEAAINPSAALSQARTRLAGVQIGSL